MRSRRFEGNSVKHTSTTVLRFRAGCLSGQVTATSARNAAASHQRFSQDRQPAKLNRVENGLLPVNTRAATPANPITQPHVNLVDVCGARSPDYIFAGCLMRLRAMFRHNNNF